MTIHSNLSSTRLSSLASTPAGKKPAASSNPGALAQPQQSGAQQPQQPRAAQQPPSLPTGLVGHNVNTTA